VVIRLEAVTFRTWCAKKLW